MKIVKIAAFDNGGHDNDTYNGRVPDGWALIACDTPNFPFGTPTVDEINGVMTVTAWEAGEMPETPTEPVITAPRNIVSGEYVTINGTLYMATQNIPNGEPIIVGQNAIETTIETVLYELNELRGE